MFNGKRVEAIIALLASAILLAQICIIPVMSTPPAPLGHGSPKLLTVDQQLLEETSPLGDLANAENSRLEQPMDDPSSQNTGGRIHNVTLVTGDSVLVRVTEDGTILSIAVKPADPTRLGRNFLVFKLRNYTYVVPGDIDLHKFDLELFNIDLLIKEEYDKLPYIPVIIEHSTDLTALTEQLEAQGGNLTHVFTIISALAAKLPKDKAEGLYKFLTYSQDVHKVWLDRKVHVCLDESIPLIGAPSAWMLGFNGSGVRIAILDTGIDSTHPCLDDLDDNSSTYDPKVIVEASFVEEPDTDPMDYNGHGTHVAGIAAATQQTVISAIEGGSRVVVDETYSTPLYSKIKIYMNDVENNDWIYYEYEFTLVTSDGTEYVVAGSSSPTLEDIKEVISYDIDGDGVLDQFKRIYIYAHTEDDDTLYVSVDAWNGTSWVTLYGESKTIGPGVAPGAWLWNVKVLNKWGRGYFSWIIAGIEYAALGPDYTPNTGDEADILSLSLGSYWWTDGTDPLSMACDRAVELGRVVVVAAGNWHGYFHIGVPATARKVITVGATDKQDNLAWFSSCGPTIDFRVKPDIVAPGVDITSSTPWGAATWSGTSMSTPHVSGAAALLKELIETFRPHYPILPDTPTVVKDILVSTCNDLGYNIYQQGSGRLNITSAIDVPVIIDPATVSLQAITEDNLLNYTLTFYYTPMSTSVPIAPENITLSLSVSVKDIITGRFVDAATLNATTITIPFNASKAVLLTLNTTVPKSLYEGIITAKVIGGPWANRVFRAMFGFARLNNVTITLLDRAGHPAPWSLVGMFKPNATSYLDFILSLRFGLTDENGMITFLVNDGEYEVGGYSADWELCSDIWTLARMSIAGNTHITLDGRLANTVDFDPAKPDQVFASKRTSVMYYARWWWDESYYWEGWDGVMSLWYYPRTALTFITNTTTYTSYGYEYYSKRYFEPSSPDVIDVPEWGNVLYWIKEVNHFTTFKANYSKLVKRITHYKTSLTPRLAARLAQHKFNPPYEGYSITFAWKMDVPQSRTEWLSPCIYYRTTYEKYHDPPWMYTPYWFFAHWPYLEEHYTAGSEVEIEFGAHPLTTQLIVELGESWLSIISDLHMDSYGHTLWWTDSGYMKIYRNGSLIFDKEVKDLIWLSWWEDPRPSRYKVVIDAESGLYLSCSTHAEFEFTVVNGSLDYTPPNVYVKVSGLDLNNTHAAGTVIVDVFIDDPHYSSTVANVTVEYSTDDGVTWKRATPLTCESYAGAPYSFSLGVLNDTFVSLRINATDSAGNRVSQTTIKAFYVKPGLSAVSWSATLTVEASNESEIISSDTVKFGVEVDATEGFDEAYDEPNPPTPPGPPYIDAYFYHPESEVQKLSVSIVDPKDNMTWRLYVHYNLKDTSQEYSLIFKWNASEIATIPSNFSVLLRTPFGTVDMREVSNYTFTVQGGEGCVEFAITVSSLVHYTLHLERGWNMISLPIVPINNTISEAFKNLEVYYIIYTWDPSARRYVKPSIIEPGRGYWVLVLEEAELNVVGRPIKTPLEVELDRGWNMIGSILDTATFEATPSGSVYQKLYTWNPERRMYEASTYIEPGKAYWILAYQPCTLTISPL